MGAAHVQLRRQRGDIATTAALFVEALDTLGVLLRAGATWLVLVALVTTLALYAVVTVVWACGRWAWKTARRPLRTPLWAHGRLSARKFVRTRTRRPSGRAEPQTYREAA